jgi:hypothetical protein
MDRLAGPSGRQDRERLVEHPSSPLRVQLLAGHRVLASELVTSQAYAEREPAAAEPVERRGLASDLDRPAAGEWRDHRPEPDPLRRRGHRR